MKYNCDLIRDLLPLYVDQACTKASAEAVEEHVFECGACAAMLGAMQTQDAVIDREMLAERSRVLDTQARFFKRRSAIAGSIIGGIFAIPILVCLIVNLVSGAGLTWFFIVLAGMLIPASLIVVPLMVPENKFLWTAGTFTASLILLLAVCSIYSGSAWFWIAAPSVLFGLAVVLLPFVVNTKPVAALVKNHKALTVIAADTLLYILMMSAIGGYTGAYDFLQYTVAFSVPPFAFAWALAALITLPKWNGWLKAAACVCASALIYFFNDTFVYLVLGGGLHFPSFSGWNDVICWCVLALGTVLAVIFAAIGFQKNKK